MERVPALVNHQISLRSDRVDAKAADWAYWALHAAAFALNALLGLNQEASASFIDAVLEHVAQLVFTDDVLGLFDPEGRAAVLQLARC